MKRHLEDKLKMKLQLFAKEDENDNPDDIETPPADDTIPPEDDGKPALKYSDDDVDEIVKKKLARAEKDKQKAVEEAEKLAKMNAEQKKEYEYDQMKAKLEALEKKEAFYELSKEAQKMLSEHGIQADDEVFNFVVKETAEDTQKAVQAFAELINAKVEAGVKSALAGKSPKVNTNKEQVKNPFAKETFNLTEQGKLLKENPELYKQLKAQANK
ncbi:DUF4355 domain-containing protein [Marinilactibacillus psychrotolerans]|uniref:DUF4355 domain-containing protein n=1 Tax=Marinilactibacillus psychrotolerans TaxID=191770 RepID=A0A5R9C409_9LACT|nr:DUF4355 domain-containing protein [Marinilactibacillus psychrotolerans]TLQ07569.1 DUF4355 domain-containing protein [Marinilactibacillus psychrotolerans]